MSWETSAAAALFPRYPRIEEHELPPPELQLSAGPVTARPHAPHQPRRSRHTRASVWQAQMSPTFLRTQDDPVLIPTSQELAFFSSRRWGARRPVCTWDPFLKGLRPLALFAGQPVDNPHSCSTTASHPRFRAEGKALNSPWVAPASTLSEPWAGPLEIP